MGDESFGALEAKNLSNLRVVDLKRELEKRGLPKSGSKKDLVKRLKQKLELEKLFEAAGSGGGVEPRLQLDEATEQNEFVRQYLENQQKLYAQQKDIIEKQGKDGEDDDECEDDEESDPGAKGHESDVSENVGVAIKTTCDSSTYESTEEDETKPVEGLRTLSIDTFEEKTEEKENSAVLDCAEQSASKIDYSEILKSESDQESSGSGKPDSTALSFEPKVEISDQDSCSQPGLGKLIIQELESPEEMHPKKSKLKKHNDKLQKTISSTPDTGNESVDVVAKTNNGADAAENCVNRTCMDQTDKESGPLALIKNVEKPTESEDMENSSSVQVVSIEESVTNMEQDKDCALDLVCKDTMEKSEDLESNKPDASHSTDENFLKDSSDHTKTEESKNIDKETDQTTGSNDEHVRDRDECVQLDKSDVHIREEKLDETAQKDDSSINEKMDVDKDGASKVSKIHIRDQRSDGSSDTEDGESKTDDEGKKSDRADNDSSNFQKEKSHNVPAGPGDSWKHEASDSSSDSDSSGGDSRRKHKSYKSSKREELFSTSSRKHIIDSSKSVDDIKSKEKSEVGYTPRRLKIKRSAFVPEESSVPEEKVFKRAKSPIISPEKSKKEKSPIISPDKSRKEKSRASSEDKPPRKEKVTEVPESKPVKKEKIQRSLSSREPSFKSSKDENQSKEKAESKKRAAENTESDPIPAKVTYRKLNVPFKKNEDKEQDSREQVSDKKRLWRSFGSKSAVNISTDTLKTIIPDFKVVCGPSLNEAEEMPSPKVASDAPSFSNKSRSNSYTEESAEKMEVDEGIGVENLKMAGKDSRKEGVESHRRTVLPKKPISHSLFIQNLVRPFTLMQLKEMLKRTGKLVEDDFWIDKIKSKCFVTYETTDQAEETKEALNGTRWPSSNPKILVVDFVTKEEIEHHKKMVEQAKPAVSLQDRLENQTDSSSLDARKKRDIEDTFREREQRPRQNITYIREWDKDKIIQEESPDKEKPLPPPKDKSRSEKKKDKKDGKRKQEDDTPAKLLDDLFHKTKTTPCIYWLPLTEEQSKEKEEQRRQRRLERERRNQEEEEQRRARRRRESRSPVRRR